MHWKNEAFSCKLGIKSGGGGRVALKKKRKGRRNRVLGERRIAKRLSNSAVKLKLIFQQTKDKKYKRKEKKGKDF